MINFAVNFFFGDVMQLKWQSDVVEYGARTQQVEVLKKSCRSLSELCAADQHSCH